MTITGTNFLAGATVKFGNTAVNPVNVSFVGTGEIAVLSSPAGTGTVDITVTTAGGTSATSAADLFTYIPVPTVTGVSPNTGSGAGGTSVTITGTNFTGVTSVGFGSAGVAASFTVNSATSITATTAPGTGTVDVTVTTAGGTSATSAADRFTFTAVPPTVTNVSPNTGLVAGGTQVTITGTNFFAGATVKFGNTTVAAGSVNVVSSTQIIVAASPPGTGTVDVTVTTGGGTSATSAADRFTYVTILPPTVTGISPNTGPSAGGTSVTITGTSLNGATAVKFGNTAAASFVVNSATSISAVSPAGTGVVDITVTTALGTSATGSADRSSYGPPPDSLKVRALQNTITPIIGQTSGQVISSAIDNAISDAFSPSDAPFTGGPNGVTFNFSAEPENYNSADAGSQRAQCFAGEPQNDSTVNSQLRRLGIFTPDTQRSCRIDDAFSALAYANNNPTKAPAGNITKAPPPRDHDWRLWLDVRGTGWAVSQPTNSDLKGSQVNVTLGLSHLLTPDVVVGAIAGYENFNYDVASLTGKFKGDGETAGGYFARRFGALRFDAALTWSYLSYNATAGTATGSLNGSRWLFSTGLTGNRFIGSFLIEPSVKVFVLAEHDRSWIDSLGTVQDARDFSAGRASVGSKVARAFDLPDGARISPFAGFYADYRFLSDNAIPTGQPVVGIADGWSGRATVGGVYTNARGAGVSAEGELGGLGASYKIWSGKIRGSIPLN